MGNCLNDRHWPMEGSSSNLVSICFQGMHTVPHPNSTSNLRPSPPPSSSVCRSGPASFFLPLPVLPTIYLPSRVQGEVHGPDQHGCVCEDYFRTEYIHGQKICLACRKTMLTLQRSRFECSLEILDMSSAASATPPEVCAWSRLD